MADQQDEMAFLASLKAANEAAGDYEAASGGDSDQAAESTSDEYHPAQAIPAVPSPAHAQKSPVAQAQSHAHLSNDSLHSASTSTFPLSSNINSAVPDTSITEEPDFEAQSVSMSRASSSDVSGEEKTSSEQIQTDQRPQEPEIFHVNGDAVQDHRDDPLPVPANVVDAQSPPTHEVKVEPASQAQPTVDVTTPHTIAGDGLEVDTIVNGTTSAAHPDVATDEQQPEQDSHVQHISVPSVPSLPKARLPHDTLGILEDRIKADPKGDLAAWLSLIGEYRKRGKLDEARSVYERFFVIFPAAAEQWVEFAQMENEASNKNGMETIFQRTLLQIPYLPLWSLYIDHIRRLHNLTTDASGTARNVIHQAYDLAMQQIGLDKNSGKLWQDFIDFLKSGPGQIGGSAWQDQQKMDTLRKYYQRAISVPTQATNALWREYDTFERGLNKTTGQKFLQDQSPAYMSARSSYTALQNITKHLRQTTLPVLPPTLGFAGDVEYSEQLAIWKRWIQWEKDDPLVLKQDDVSAYRARIIFVYKQALMAMRFWPELWCDASEFCFLNDMESEGNLFLSNGASANPESCLLAFKRADRIELTTANEEGEEGAKRRGTAVREPYDKVLDALYDLIAKSKSCEERDLAQIEATHAVDDVPQPNGTGEDDDDEDATLKEDELKAKQKQKLTQIDSVKRSYAAQMRLLSRTLSHVWIALMRSMRRIQGKASFRAVFGEARKRGRITPEVYIAVALIEFHCYEPDTARKIFDRGLKLFQEDEAFALAYIKHLVANNDHTNARVTFETAVTRLEKKPETIVKAKSLYVYFHEFESRYGELAQIVKLEKRMKDLFPDDLSLAIFSARFTDQGFDPTAIRPAISPSQSRPKIIAMIPNTDIPLPNPESQLPPGLISTPPKRSLPIDEDGGEDDRQSKIQRTNSPLKGAAGRRLDQQKRSQLPVDPPLFSNQPIAPPHPLPPPPLPRDVVYLLSIIPKAHTYTATKFSPSKLVQLIRQTEVPTTMAQLPAPAGRAGPGPSLPPQAQHMLSHPQHMQPPIHHTPPIPLQGRSSLPPMPVMPQQQYGQFNGGQFASPYSQYSR